MPSIKQYAWKDTTRFSITCKNRCCYVGNEIKDIKDAIAAWNVLIAGPDKPPVLSESPYHVVQYERKVKPIKKYGGTSMISNLMLTNMDVHTRRQVVHNEMRRCYHKIADELFDAGIGKRKVDASDYQKDVILNVSLQVVDDR